MSAFDHKEPLLMPDENRHVMFPIKYQDVWKMYKLQQDSFWRVEEVDLSRDMNDWVNLTDDERYFIKMVLGFFAASDGIIVENLAHRFMNEVQHSEIRAFYSMQSFMENIHSEMYSLLIDTYITDKSEKDKLFHAVDHFPCIKKKADWAKKWIADNRSMFATRLVAFACVEGIHFSGSFASIYWLKKRGKMRGLTLSNEFISRDESMHTDFAVLLYGKLEHKLSEKRFHEIVTEAVKLEQEFITEALPCSLVGMNCKMMSQYIEFVGDRLSLQMGYKKIFGSANPFDFMELISVETKTNFFESVVSDYSLANTKKDDNTFDLACEF